MKKDYYALFAAHHRKLIGNIDQLTQQAEADVLHTPELLTYLWEYLIPHAHGEEATLYKRADTLPGGHAIVQPMSDEHAVIIQHIRDVQRAFETGEDGRLKTILQTLRETLHAHFRKEEDVLIPLLQEHLSPAAFGELVEAAHDTEGETKPSDIKRCMDMDHRRLDRLIKTFSTARRDGLGKAVPLFAQVRTHLLRHISWEEDLLFPAFEAKTGMHDTGPTAVMRQEHEQVKAAMEQIAGLLEARQAAGIEPVEQDLVHVLSVHNQKEEQILYPLINQRLSVSERNEILAKMG